MSDVNGILKQQAEQINRLEQDAYIQSLRYDLLIKLIYKHGLLKPGTIAEAWEPFLWNEIGAPNQYGMMKGFLKVSHYE